MQVATEMLFCVCDQVKAKLGEDWVGCAEQEQRLVGRLQWGTGQSVTSLPGQPPSDGPSTAFRNLEFPTAHLLDWVSSCFDSRHGKMKGFFLLSSRPFDFLLLLSFLKQALIDKINYCRLKEMILNHPESSHLVRLSVLFARRGWLLFRDLV